jgi:hypothetical protein
MLFGFVWFGFGYPAVCGVIKFEVVLSAWLLGGSEVYEPLEGFND